MKNRFNLNDYEMLTGSDHYDFDLPQEVSDLRLSLFSDAEATVYLVNGEKACPYLYGRELFHRARLHSATGLRIRVDGEATLGVRLEARPANDDDTLDFTPVQVAMSQPDKISFNAAVQAVVRQQLRSLGAEPATMEELLEGDFEFEDDDDDFGDTPFMEDDDEPFVDMAAVQDDTVRRTDGQSKEDQSPTPPEAQSPSETRSEPESGE